MISAVDLKKNIAISFTLKSRKNLEKKHFLFAKTLMPIKLVYAMDTMFSLIFFTIIDALFQNMTKKSFTKSYKLYDIEYQI